MIYTVELSKPDFKFSSAHFTILDAKSFEPLHGHNYQLGVRLDFDSLAPDLDLTVDFGVVKEKIRHLVKLWDDKILVPKHSPYLEVNKVQENQIQVLNSVGKKYSFPESDVCFIDAKNSSSEALSRVFGEMLIEELKGLNPQDKFLNRVSILQVWIDETEGQRVTCSFGPDSLVSSLGVKGEN